MTENVNKGKLTTPLFRLSFAQLDKPKAFENGDPKYGLTMLFPKGTGLAPLKKLAYQAVVDKWGSDKKSWPPNLRNIDWKTYLSSTGKDGWPFRDGDLQDYDGYAGQISISCRNTIKPVVVDSQKRPIIDMNEVYSGCYGHAVITSYAYENKSKGVTFSLLAFMKVKDGEPFTRRFDPDTDFAGIDYSEMAESGEFADPEMDF